MPHRRLRLLDRPHHSFALEREGKVECEENEGDTMDLSGTPFFLLPTNPSSCYGSHVSTGKEQLKLKGMAMAESPTEVEMWGVKFGSEAYKDLLQEFFRGGGKNLGTLMEAISTAFLPLKVFVWAGKKVENIFLPTLAKAITERNIPEARYIPPPDSIFGRSMVGAGFADDPTIMELYANLVTSSMDIETAKYAHPAFIDIIQQISPDEAKILGLFRVEYNEVCYANLISVHLEVNGLGVNDKTYFSPSILSLKSWEEYLTVDPGISDVYMGNLQRLLLIQPDSGEVLRRVVAGKEVPHTSKEPCPDFWKCAIETIPALAEAVKAYDAGEMSYIVTARMIRLTHLGVYFMKACTASKEG